MNRPSRLLPLLLLLPVLACAFGRFDARDADECRSQVNAVFDATVAKMRAQGNTHGVAVVEQVKRPIELRACDQMERSAQDRRMVAAFERLGAVMDTIIADGKPTEADLHAVREDAEAIQAFKPAPYRDAYLQRLSDYRRLVEQGPTPAQRSTPPLAPRPQAPALVPNLDVAAADSAGRLRQWGAYLGTEAGQVATQLSDGSVFVIGAGLTRDDADDPLRLSDELRRRDGARAQASRDPAPKWWDPTRRGWRRLPAAPECARGQRVLHSVTPLPDDKVLVAGGLCDEPQAVNEPKAPARFDALSLWDARTRAWLPAPALAQGRIDHSATLLADGTVLIAGGQSDPALAAAASRLSVLASAQRFAGGKMLPVPPLAHARAGHSATLMADGSVVVVGGFDDQGHALHTAERWSIGDAAWQEVPALHFARHGHTATRLADGRLLVTGGVGADGGRLTAVELWEPEFQTWRAAPSLPVPLAGHAGVRLSDGRVLLAGGARMAALGALPWAWIWGPGDAEWRIAGRTESIDVRRSADPVTLFARADGGALALTGETILRWDPIAAGAGQAPPLWRGPPAAARLPDGRVMFVGLGTADLGSTQSAYLWNPAQDSWSTAGRLAGGVRLHAALLVLRSGRVLHLALEHDRGFVCDGWDAAGPRWTPCGRAALQYTSQWDLQPGLLADGRAFVVVNRHEVLVFDEAHSTWATWRPEWNVGEIALGSPISMAAPLALVRDPASVDHPFQINDAGARLRQAEGTVPRMLWDARAGRWAYVLQGGMGRNAQFLADGCALSTSPLALFDPASGRASALADPGFGVAEGRATMLVLTDGTVVVAGVAAVARDAGAGFFHRKAGCQGFEPSAVDESYISGALAVDPPAVVAKPASASPAPAQPSGPRRALAWAQEHRWLLLAVGGPFVLWLLLRHTRLQRMQIGPSWALRALVLGVVLIGVMPTAWTYLRFESARKAVACSEDPAACLDTKSGLIKAAGGTLPCGMIGIWTSRQGNQVRRIEFKDDGTYAMAPSEAGGDPPGGYKGHWIVQGHNVVWRHAGAGDADINAMQSDGDDRFTLVEMNGARTRFERVRGVVSQRCTS